VDEEAVQDEEELPKKCASKAARAASSVEVAANAR
jgi:hypothetical protein